MTADSEMRRSTLRRDAAPPTGTPLTFRADRGVLLLDPAAVTVGRWTCSTPAWADRDWRTCRTTPWPGRSCAARTPEDRAAAAELGLETCILTRTP